MSRQQLAPPQSHPSRHPSGRNLRLLIVVIAALFLLVAAVLAILNIGPVGTILSAFSGALGVILALAQWLLPISSDSDAPPAPLPPPAPPTPIILSWPPLPVPMPTTATPLDDDPHLWSVPYTRNPLFTGRDELLQRLHERLSDRRTAALTQAISGLGGIGKTQTALEYAYRHRDEYRVIAWLKAESRETLIADLLAVARLLNLPALDERNPAQMLATLMRWCASHEHWLLIYDNADDPAPLADLFPAGGKGHVLLTTRAQALGTLAVPLEVESMGHVEGAELLLRRARLLTDAAPLSAAAAHDRAQAEQLTEVLGGLPLALDQAAAYIEETGCSLADYQSLFERRRDELLGRRDRFASYRETVATTWSLAFRTIEQSNPGASALLSLCAFLAPDLIAETLLTVGSVDLGQPLTEMMADAGRFNEAIEVVRRYSLLQRNRATQALSMHRLVQIVLQTSMPPQTQHLWAERAVRLVEHALPEVDRGALARFQPFLAQAEHCAYVIEQYNLVSLDAAYMLHGEGLYLYHTAQYPRAEVLYQRALAIELKLLGEEHSSTANTQHELAVLYQQQGKYPEAVALYQRALQSKLNLLGEEHSSTSATQHALAGLYEQQGKYPEAEALYQRSLQSDLKLRGEEHPSTAATQHELAELYRQQGRYPEAEALYQRALQSKLKLLGEEHPETAATQHELAALYWQQGRYPEAVALLQRALQSTLKLLGEEHPDTAATQQALAVLYQEQGKHKEAEALYKQSLRVMEKLVGDSHPDTLITLDTYAHLLRTLHRDNEAAVLEARARAGRAQRAGGA